MNTVKSIVGVRAAGLRTSLLVFVSCLLLFAGCGKKKPEAPTPAYLDAISRADEAERTRDLQNLLQALEKASSSCPARECPEVQRRWGEALLAAGETDKAKEVLLLVAERFPESREAPLALIEVAKLAEAAQDPSARDLYLRVIALDPANVAASRAVDRLIFAAQEKGGPQAARDEIDAIYATLDPKDELAVELLFRRAEFSDALSLPEEARKDDEAVFAAGPSYPHYDDAAFRLSERYLKIGDRENAERVLKALLSTRRNSWLTGSSHRPYLDDAMLLLGDIRRDANDIPGALRAYEDLVKHLPDSILRDDALFRIISLEGAEPKKRCKALKRFFEETPDSRHASKAKEIQGQLNCP